MVYLVLIVSLLVVACSEPPEPSPGDLVDVGADVRRDRSPDGSPSDVAVGDAPDLADLADDSDVRADSPPDGPVVIDTTSGTIRGERVGGIESFVGIPYAEAPVGERRWTAPEQVSWSDTLDATTFGNRCLQPNINFTRISGDEDCLVLNVWRPATDEPLPVMVWFHGGSFVQGAGSEQTYRGHDLVEHDVIVVTANYRLGALGYLAHPGIGETNFGLRDQLLVLDWVRDNTEALGGISGEVTVFGESAGGISACAMIAGGHAEGRFERAITQSGPCVDLLELPDRANAEEQGESLAAALGCDTDADPIGCMRAADAESVVDALGFRPGVIFGDGAAWTLVRDDELVPLDLADALAIHDVPLLTGANADEGSLVRVGAEFDVVVIDYEAATAQMFGDAADAVRARYPLADYDDDADAIAAIVDDRFVCGTRRVARLRSEAGFDTWLYHFTHPFVTPIGDLGAMHGAELPFVFGTELVLVKLRPDQEPLSEQMQRYWTNFARSGDPNADGEPIWPRYDAAGDAHVVLDTEVTTGEGLRREICDFWDSL